MIDKQITQREQMAELQRELEKLKISIAQADRFLAAKPGHESTTNRYNILQHNRSEILTKIRKLKEKMG